MKMKCVDVAFILMVTTDSWRFVDLRQVADGCEIDVPPRFIEVLRLYPH